MKWLFLRGEWDCRTAKSIKDNDDMWLELFRELSKNDECYIHFLNAKEDQYNCDLLQEYDIIFSRGGFKWQSEILKAHPESFKIYYGAGRRFVPDDNIKYDLVLCDSHRQKKAIEQAGYNGQLFFKPAASCFKPHNVKKEYDVCYIANGQQAQFKGVQWVYETAPKNLKILHLGYPSKLTPPENVTCKRVDRIDMAKEISKCKVGIVPYFNKIDSGPRVIPEMLACGLPVYAANNLHLWKNKYQVEVRAQWGFWQIVKDDLEMSRGLKNMFRNNRRWYNNNLSLKHAATHLREIINNSCINKGIKV